MIDYDDYFGGLTREEYEEQTREHFEWLRKNCSIADGGAIAIRVPKAIASITLCGAVHFNIDDTMDFKTPTPEQIKNLKETFCIDVELFD